MSRTTQALVLAAAVGAGAALARSRAGDRTTPDALPAPPLEGRRTSLTTADGVELAVEVHEPDGATVGGTVVLLHGYVQSSRLWAGQVGDLRSARPDLRVVVYDHRGHGRSTATGREHARLEQLGRDLAQVLEEVVPVGPVLLAGHSMGGMTIMALAEQRPELFTAAGPVTGVAFLATSSGGLGAVTWGLPAPVARVVRALLPRANEKAVRAEAAGRARRAGAVERRLLFPRGADPEHVRQVLAVQSASTAETTAAFLPTFEDHDRAHALVALAGLPVLVLAGDADLLCPLPHSRAIAAALPAAELVVYPGVGHMVHLERREEVGRQLLRLADAVLPPRAPVSP